MKKTIFAMLILFILPFAAAGNYNETGNYNAYFQQGTGQFNLNLASYDSSTRALTTPRQTPLVSDLDGDGVNEIIVIDASNIRLYQGKGLDIVDSYLINGDAKMSNLIAYDIDADLNTELIFVEYESDVLNIIEYNGTAFNNKSEHDISSLTRDNDATGTIKCRGTNDCIMVYSQTETGSGTGNLWAVAFNITAIDTDEYQVDTETHANSNYCPPFLNTMIVADYDNDGTEEYITAFNENEGGGEVDVLIYYIDVVNGSRPILEQSIEHSSGFDTAIACNAPRIRSHTPPLVFDADGAPSNGLETIIGAMTDQDSFKMYSYSSDGSSLDDYPEILTVDGIIVSNVVRMNSFTDTEAVDFCVMGYQTTDSELDLACASEQTSQIPETDDFEYLIPEFNISGTSTVYNSMIHAVQHTTDTIDNNNLNEIITSYGIFELDYSGINHLDLIWQSPQEDSALISVDTENVDKDDLIALTSSNIWYFDDGFSFSPAIIAEYTVDPCLDSVWKVNTSYEIRVKVTDADNDNVGARAVMYKDSSFENDFNWTANSSSGATFVFSGVADNIIGTGNLQILGRDVRQPALTDEVDLTFSVGVNGVEFGDCSTSVTLDSDEDGVSDEEEAEEVDGELPSGAQDNNTIAAGIQQLDDIGGGLGVTVWGLLIWLIGVGTVMYTMLFKWKLPADVSVLGGFGLGFVLLIIFNLLGVVSISVTLLIIFALSIASIPFIRRLYTGQGAG